MLSNCVTEEGPAFETHGNVSAKGVRIPFWKL